MSGRFAMTLPVQLDRLAPATGSAGVACALHGLLELDQALWVVRFGVAFLRRGVAAADVAERPQTLDCLGCFFARSARRSHVERLQRIRQHLRARRAGRCQVLRFPGIAGKVVKLREGQIDEFLAAHEHAAKRRPAPRHRRHHRLEVRRPVGTTATGHHVAERAARQTGHCRRAHDVQNRRQDVDVADRIVDDHDVFRRLAGAHRIDLRDDERHRRVDS